MIGSLISLAGELALIVWLVTAVFWAVASTALSTWLGRSWWLGSVLGAVLLPLGPVVLLIVAGVARSKRKALRLPRSERTPAPAWESHVLRWTMATGAALLAAALLWVTGLPDTQLVLGDRRMDLAVRDVGLSAVTLLSVVALAVVAAVSAWRPTRWCAVVVSWCGAWWLLWSLAALLIGDTLRALVAATRVTTVVPVVVRIGDSWSLLFGQAVLLVAWSAAVLIVVIRAAPARRSRRDRARWAERAHVAPPETPPWRPAGATAGVPWPRAADRPVGDPSADRRAEPARALDAPTPDFTGWTTLPTTQRAARREVELLSDGL